MNTRPIGILNDFRILRPKHEIGQAEALDWLAAAHAQADAVARGLATPDARKREVLSALFRRVGCGPDRIERRGTETLDALKSDFAQMELYRIDTQTGARGAGILERTRHFAQVARRALDELYPADRTAPDHLVHVTCTGYVSPSAAQSLVADRGWSSRTGVTHAYHMGCYASIPAIRIAAGQLALSARASARADIVHNELCSLHLDPLEHSPEQAVVQSLFGDGHVRYSVKPHDSPHSDDPGLAVHALREYIVPGTQGSMSWQTADWGMKMTLSREVPRQVGASIEPFLEQLLEGQDMSLNEARDTALFAVHPGGPKIIEHVQEALGLQDAQVSHSRAVLRRYGNMSSATLPHIWHDVIADESVARGRPVVSLAFGPGLTIFGMLLRKR